MFTPKKDICTITVQAADLAMLFDGAKGIRRSEDWLNRTTNMHYIKTIHIYCIYLLIHLKFRYKNLQNGSKILALLLWNYYGFYISF